MRLKALLFGDIHFQIKYGFYFVYAIFSILYIALIYAFPRELREKAGIIMIFTDPAAMGLYFMGAIVLLEKSERVIDSIAISPVRPLEYVFSKTCSIALVSTIAALAIGIGGGIVRNCFYFTLSVFLCSCFFSTIGLIFASKISSLNSFILATIPAELIINIPAFAYILGYRKNWLLFHPGICMIEACINGTFKLLSLAVIIIWTMIFALYARSSVKKMLNTLGGANL